MDIRKVKKLIELLDESGIAEIEISEGGRFSKNIALCAKCGTGRAALCTGDACARTGRHGSAGRSDTAGGGSTGSRTGRRRLCRNGTDGGHLLFRAVTRCASLRPGR